MDTAWRNPDQAEEREQRWAIIAPWRALKVRILTFHKCINYGSYWQARCRVEVLRARGHHSGRLFQS
jgi:hypothetical protein